LSRLEPYAVKVASTVLKERWRSNALPLPDNTQTSPILAVIPATSKSILATCINQDKIEKEHSFDGKWVLITYSKGTVNRRGCAQGQEVVAGGAGLSGSQISV